MACSPTVPAAGIADKHLAASIQEAVGLLVTCHKFEIEGAAATIRKMLPLTFSREQGTIDDASVSCQELSCNLVGCGCCRHA